MSGTLYILATPIGNLEDMTFRAVRILGEVDLIAAEDTRHSLKLLNHFGISKPLTSYFDHNQQFKGERILQALRQEKSVALISDAGTPCISDPGFNLVRAAVAAGISVIPRPGPCAAVTALSASGLPSDTFTFAGFPPARQGKRRAFLNAMVPLPGTLVLYEAPHRLEETLRMQALLDQSLRDRIHELRPGQFVALRFASDGELATRVAEALDEGLSGAEIKKRILSWRADTFRV